MSLSTLTGAELLELRKRVTSAAIKLYQSGSAYTRQQAALPELSTPELVAEWRTLRDKYAVTIAAAEEQFELLEVIAQEYARRALEAAQPLEGMDPEQVIRHLEAGNADA